MDAEEARRSFAQAALRCLSLEIDRDVEILRAQKFREIISVLTGEDVDAVPPGGTLAPSGVSVRPTLQPVSLIFISKMCGTSISLTPKPFQLLSYLPRDAPELASRPSTRTPNVAHPSRVTRNGQEEGRVAVAVRQAQQVCPTPSVQLLDLRYKTLTS
jgi:hypothetical protein